jgi:hypothetical protein
MYKRNAQDLDPQEQYINKLVKLISRPPTKEKMHQGILFGHVLAHLGVVIDAEEEEQYGDHDQRLENGPAEVIEDDQPPNKRRFRLPAGAKRRIAASRPMMPTGRQDAAAAEQALVEQQHAKDGDQDQGAHLSSPMGMEVSCT